MIINMNQIISITEANQNFSRATKIADREGSVIIFKHNKPRYMIVSLPDNMTLEFPDDEKIDVVAKGILEKHRKVFEELAK